MSQLPGGLTLRPARDADREQIESLLAERGDPDDAVDHRLVLDDPEGGLESCAVVVDGDRVVSTVTLLDDSLILNDVSIPAGQVDFVATDRAYEGRGCVRALMAWAHQRSAARGHLVGVMVGIPYFYRLFGYQYAVPIPQARRVSHVPPAPDDVAVRPATAADIPAMAALQDAAQAGYDLRLPHSSMCWRSLVARHGSTALIAWRDAVPIATGRVAWLDGGEAALGEIAAADVPGAYALVAHAAQQVGVDRLRVVERPGSLAGDAVEELLSPAEQELSSYYIRVPDFAALLTHLRPVLSARLVAAGLGDERGEAVVSLFREHVRLPYAGGEVGEVSRGGRLQSPAAVGGAGVAPDLTAHLLFGPYGMSGLAQRHADVYPGPQRTLMSALFPPVRADLLTFFLPL